MKYKKLLLATAVFTGVLITSSQAVAQGCNIIQNPGFTNTTAPLFNDITNTDTPPWTVLTGSPQLYPNTTIYMWDIPGSGGSESIQQMLCSSITGGAATDPITFSIDAQTNANNNGVIRVSLSNGVNSVNIFSGPLTAVMATYTVNNVESLLTPGTVYDRIIIRPVGNLPSGRMDIIVDNIVLNPPSRVGGMRYLVDMACCQPGTLTYPGPITLGVPTPQWIDIETGAVLGTGTSLPVTPGKSGSSYLFKQGSGLVNCAGTQCSYTLDTVVVRCCGGDDDWVFSDPVRITSVDQIHRTGDVNIGNIAIVPGAPDIAKVEIKNNDNAKWGQFILNGGGNGRMLRLKGGFIGGMQSIFQVEANGVTDYTEDNIRFNVLANGNVGLGVTTPAFQLDLSTNSAGKPGSNVWTIKSDKRLKKDIEPFSEGLELLEKVNPVWFRYTGELNTPDKERFVGILAQDIQKIAPYMVKDDTYTREDGSKVNYLSYDGNAMTYIIINAIKQQQQQLDAKDKAIQALNDKLTLLQESIDACCNTKNSGTGVGDKTAVTDAKLYQNTPNPFSQATEIAYELPAGTSMARIIIHDITSREIRSIPVKGYGYGTVTIPSSELQSGTYLYSLSINGKDVDTKRMVITK